MKRLCWPVVLLIVLLIAPLPGMTGTPDTTQASTGQDKPRINANSVLSLNASRTAKSRAPTLAADAQPFTSDPALIDPAINGLAVTGDATVDSDGNDTAGNVHRHCRRDHPTNATSMIG